MKKKDKLTQGIIFCAVGFTIGLYTGDHFGQEKGYSEGYFDGSSETFDELSEPIDSLSAAYIQMKREYDNAADQQTQI